MRLILPSDISFGVSSSPLTSTFKTSTSRSAVISDPDSGVVVAVGMGRDTKESTLSSAINIKERMNKKMKILSNISVE